MYFKTESQRQNASSEYVSAQTLQNTALTININIKFPAEIPMRL